MIATNLILSSIWRRPQVFLGPTAPPLSAGPIMLPIVCRPKVTKAAICSFMPKRPLKSPIVRHFAFRLREMRLARGLSQENLAGKANLHCQATPTFTH